MVIPQIKGLDIGRSRLHPGGQGAPIAASTPSRDAREDARASRGGNFFALENCGAIATFVANFCRADFSGPRYGKP